MQSKFVPVKDLESDYASDAHQYAIMRGWFTFKVESPTMDGLPDRFYARRGVVIFIEWKKPNGPVRKKQEKRIKEMLDHGLTVYIFDNLADAKAVLK